MSEKDNGKRERLLTQKQVAAICQVAESTVSGWLNRKELKHIVLPGGRRRVREGVLVVYLETVIGK